MTNRLNLSEGRFESNLEQHLQGDCPNEVSSQKQLKQEEFDLV